MKIIEKLSEVNINQESFPIFFWDKWRIVEEVLHHKQRLLCSDEDNNIVAFTVYKMRFFKKADYLYVPLDKNGNRLLVEKEKSFLEEFHNYLRMNNIADAIFPPSHIVVFNAIPSRSIYYEFGIMASDLTLTEEELLKKSRPNTRNEIRKANSYGVEVKFGRDYIDDFYKCFQLTVKQKRFDAQSKEYFNEMSKLLGDNVEVGVAYFNDSLESAEFSIFDNKNIYVLYAGTSFTPCYKGSNKFLIWNLFMNCKLKGIENLLYGGYRYGLDETDPLYHVQKFKKHLGVDVIDGYHFIKVLNPLKYNFVNFALKCKSLITGRNYSFLNLSGLNIKESK